MVVIMVQTHCRGRAPEGRGSPRKSGILPALREDRESKYSKNITNEASMSLKTRKGAPKTNLKQSENEGELAAQCAPFAVNSRFLAPHTSCQGFPTGNPVEFETARVRQTRSVARKYENRGNEAKKWLKTKDITFFDGANYARFVRKFALMGR